MFLYVLCILYIGQWTWWRWGIAASPLLDGPRAAEATVQ